MLPPEYVDALVARAVQGDEFLVDALQDAATYRYIANYALTQWHHEMELRRRTERRLREVMGMQVEDDDAQ